MRTLNTLSIAIATAAGLATACVPSRAALFDPVRQATLERIGIEPEWRSDWRRPPEVERRVHALLAQPLTAETAALIAVLNSSELQARYADLGASGAAVGGSRALPNPEVEAQLRFPLDGGETQVEINAVESVTGLLAILPRSSAADAELRAARRRAVALTIDLAARARVAFYQAAAAERLRSLRRTIAEAAVASATLARSLHEAGNITDFDLARETVFEEEALLDAREAEAEATAARERVNGVLGLHGDETAWQLTAPLPDAPAERAGVAELEGEAVAASLELEAARWRIEAAGRRIGVARLDSWLPDLGVGVSAKKEEGDWGVGPAVTLSVPIFDWGQGKRAEAWAGLRAAQHEYTDLAVKLRAAARASGERLVVAHDRATRIRQVVMPLRERLLDEAVLQYNAMNLSPLELLVLRREHIEAEERFIHALLDYWVARTEVEQLRAGSMPGDKE